MLTEKEIKKIDDLIDQNKSNYRIGKETHHSPNTINKRRLEREKIGQEQRPREEVLVKNPIDIVRRTIKEIDAIIQTKQLEDRKKRNGKNGQNH